METEKEIIKAGPDLEQQALDTFLALRQDIKVKAVVLRHRGRLDKVVFSK